MTGSNRFTELLRTQFPNIDCTQQSIFSTVHLFANYTCSAITSGDIGKIKECFQFAEQIAVEGNDMLISLLQNHFIPAIALTWERNEPFGVEARKMLPLTIKSLYCRQIYAKGC